MDGNLKFCEMSAKDLPSVLEIGRECRLSDWSLQAYQDELDRADSIRVVAKSGGETIGFIIARLIMPKEIEIYNIAVRESYRRSGIADELLRRATSVVGLESVWLEVRKSNLPAISFYQKNGFTVIGVRRGFYKNPTEDALLMKLDIPGNRAFEESGGVLS